MGDKYKNYFLKFKMCQAWGDFFNYSNISIPLPQYILNRIRANLTFYAYNYFIISILLFILFSAIQNYFLALFLVCPYILWKLNFRKYFCGIFKSQYLFYLSFITMQVLYYKDATYVMGYLFLLLTTDTIIKTPKKEYPEGTPGENKELLQIKV